MTSRNIRIEPFGKRFVRDRFNCGHEELDDWLRHQAGQQERRHNTRTFLAVDADDVVVGFYATSTYRLDLDEAARAYGVGKRQYPVPAVLLARLAVHKDAQGSGIGGLLLVDTLSNIAAAGRSLGFEMVVVHAIDDDAVTFYARYGLQRFEEHPRHLFMTTKNLVATMDGA